VDTAGKGLSGFLEIDAFDPQETPQAVHKGRLGSGRRHRRRSILFPQLPPGKYRLVFYRKTREVLNRRQPLYWLNSADQRIELKLGQHIDNIRFEVPQ
jgi:hypothetical protein